MFLRSLKLRGFKSFPDAVEIRLEPGVAIVVGPNGSGKSNIGDAIRWAAGSLSPQELRAEKADDVLYAGSGGRAAADHCEVELVFDNADGTRPYSSPARGVTTDPDHPPPNGITRHPHHPPPNGITRHPHHPPPNGITTALDYSELSITRRLHRGGEGQYLVNRAPVRRLDLVELLADLGLGGEMHSIISQGKVEQILASKPAERRALVEEAAGLGKFKRRRHRAELKLARVAVQVERARDLEDEVRKRLRPLALQATAAERAEKLRHEIGALGARVAELDLAELERRLAEANERKEVAERARRTAREKLEAVLDERNRAEEELADAAGRREEATAALYRLRSAAERVELRHEAAEALTASLLAELASAQEDTLSSSPEIERLRREAAAAAEVARVAARKRVDALMGLRPVAARLAADHEEQLATALRERAAAEGGLVGIRAERDAIAATLQRLAGAHERTALRREGIEGLLGQLRRDLEETREQEARPGPSPAELERAADDASAAARAAGLERDSLVDRARAARERLAALEQSLREREGIPPAARALAEEGERLALSLLEVEPGAERAVTAALAWRASAVLARDAEAGLALLERARDHGLGSLAVVLAATGPGGGVPPVAGARPLADAVTGPAEAVGLLAGIWLVGTDDLLAAASGTVVTAEGHGYDADRGELWFAGETAEAVLLELESRRRALAAEASDLDRRGIQAAEAAGEAARRAVEAEAAYAAVAHLRRAGRTDPATLEALLDAGGRLDRALGAAAAAVARIEEPFSRRQVALGADAERLSVEAGRLAAAEPELRRAARAASERLTAADLELARLGLEPVAAIADQDVPGQVEELAARAESAAREAEAADEAARSAASAYAEAAPRRRDAGEPVLLEALSRAAQLLERALTAAAASAGRFDSPLRARVDAGSVRTGELAGELRRLGVEEAELRRATTEASEGVAAIEVELARLDAAVAEVRRRLEAAPPAADGDDRDVLVERLARHERRLEQLGQVNPLAKEDHEREKSRLAELTVQRADLEASLAELERLRAELTETVEKRFAETYRAVESHFAEVASTLFPGGEGRLRLAADEDTEDEPGIEIELQPAGKRITRLSLLSGGEKALGAISFLFALFLARPCPFYLLDEVEAALDDTNIGRFVELLRRFSERAQFVVVTHQKRTMEAADILYGVTMGPDGVTQVVSKRLAAVEAHASSA